MEHDDPTRDLNEVLVFTRVVQSGSFTAAARTLGMPKSTVSRRISELERRLGARLLQRTTRKLSLTDVGRLYFQHSARAVVEVEAADLAVARMQEIPRGLLRITAPLNFSYLGPILCSFQEQYPEVEVEMVCTDRVVDLIDEGFDLGIRAGQLRDSGLVARPMGALRRVVVASPGYLATRTVPALPSDLREHLGVVFGGGAERNRWRLQSADAAKVVEVVVPARLTVNDFDLVREAALAGLGVAMLPLDRCAEDLAADRLRRLLPSWCSPPTPIQAVYPSTRHLSPKIRAFLDHVRDRMTPLPWERAEAPAPAPAAAPVTAPRKKPGPPRG